MIELPDTAAFAAALAERRFIVAAAVAGLAGLVRGFSGFGGALIYMPLIASIYDPRTAAVTILLVDYFCSTPFAIAEVRRCNWKEVWPISAAMALGVPFGAWALIVLDPIVLRWAIVFMVLSLLVPLTMGWRFRGTPSLPLTAGVGFFAGIAGGAVQIAGPPVILYWLSRAGSAVTVRANVMVFFFLLGSILVTVYALHGLFGPHALALSALLGVPYLLGVAIGSYFFRGTSDALYRRAAYVIIALAALLSLPLLDRWLR